MLGQRERMGWLATIAMLVLGSGRMVLKMRDLMATNIELELQLGKLQGAPQGSSSALVKVHDAVPTPCPVIPPPTPCPPASVTEAPALAAPTPCPEIPPPTPCPPASMTGAPALEAPKAAGPPAPVPLVAGVGGNDWRLPKGPAPPRPPTMPQWFKWQPKAEEWCIPGPHSRHHSKRVAAIVVNYNMVERANSIAEGIKKHVKWPVDIIVVDNGSDLKDSPPSPYTAIRLEANVQTTNGWLMGIEYAKALGHAYGYCHMAYWVWITSSDYVDSEGDVLTPMAQYMIDNPKVVGMCPGLTADSTTGWPHLKRGNDHSKVREVKFIDNLATLWRAEWFDSIGTYDPDELRGFGVEMEASYLARYSGRTVVVDDRVQIKKTSGVAYKMKRMNADAGKRGDTAVKEMRNLLGNRYGGGRFEGGYTTWSNMPHDKLPPDNDFKVNPRAFFTNRRNTWFDDYTQYKEYVGGGPKEIPMFQFPLAQKPKAAGTNGLKSHGLKRRMQQSGETEVNSSTTTGLGPPEADSERHSYEDWYRRALLMDELREKGAVRNVTVIPAAREDLPEDEGDLLSFEAEKRAHLAWCVATCLQRIVQSHENILSCREEWLAMAEHSAPEYEQAWTPIADTDGSSATRTHTPAY